jgi:ribosomal protein L11 methyltransferase
MHTIKLIFENIDEAKSDIIAALLSNEEVEGFEYEYPHFFAFFTEEKFDENAVREILDPYHFEYRKERLAPQNWNEIWEKSFEPILVNDFVGVRAHFHPPFQHIQYDIEITPKMSFGTGHHATTQLMLQYMCETDFEKKTVFDFGSGTGVLAIFASMKGAESVVAIDNDAWSVLNAIENCERNNCTNIRVSADEIDVISGTFDIILANINLNILIQYKGQIKHLLKPNGKLFLSGLLTSDKTNILSHYQEMGFELLSAKQQKEWIALEMTLTQ